ncbi:MAG: MFS transporter [Candidatus Omnitrophica bacterium]|nr:MFS transporter [Candidatus Omnitrophota bacterium]
MSKISKVLRNRDFMLLWIGQIISQVGDRLDQMAIIGLVYARMPGSPLQIAKILSFTIMPVFLIGPMAGVYVDRWNRRRTMYVCDFLRALLVFSIPFFLLKGGTFIPIYFLIFLSYSTGRFFIPAKMSIVPDLVEKDDLLLANSLVNTTGMIAAIMGFGIGGIVVEWLGARGGFMIDAFSFFISALLVFLISKKVNSHIRRESIGQVSKEIVEVIRKSVMQEFVEGIKYFFTQKDLRFTANMMFLLMAALGSVYVVVIVFVQSALQSATRDLGFLIMFLGTGLFIGSILYGKFGGRFSQRKVIFTSLCVSGIVLVNFTLSLRIIPHFFLAAAFSLALGISVSPIMIACNTIIHRVSDNQMMGKIFSSLEIVMHLAFLLFMLISSFLAEKIDSVWILMVVGIILTITGISGLNMRRKIEWLE